MTRFPEFLALARRWPGGHVVRVASCRREYEACLMVGCSEADIIAGTEYWLEHCVPADTSNFYALAPHTFLAEQSFLVYQPVERTLRAVE